MNQFKELDLRLRSLIQKLACPESEKDQKIVGSCNVDKQTGCDRTRNEICVIDATNRTKCKCPEKFQRHPLTHVCGGDLCNLGFFYSLKKNYLQKYSFNYFFV